MDNNSEKNNRVVKIVQNSYTVVCNLSDPKFSTPRNTYVHTLS